MSPCGVPSSAGCDTSARLCTATRTAPYRDRPPRRVGRARASAIRAVPALPALPADPGGQSGRHESESAHPTGRQFARGPRQGVHLAARSSPTYRRPPGPRPPDGTEGVDGRLVDPDVHPADSPTARPARSSTALASVMSVGTTSVRAPWCLSHSRAVASSTSSRRAACTTAHPLRAKASVVALPIPLDALVTTTTCLPQSHSAPPQVRRPGRVESCSAVRVPETADSPRRRRSAAVR